MASELAKTNGAHSLAATVYRGDYDAAQLAGQHTREDVHAALAEVRRWLVPMNERDPKLAASVGVATAAIADHPELGELAEELKMIGRRVRPDFSEDQAVHWVGGSVLALTNLPPHVAVQAARAARHRAFSFLGDVDKAVREEAAKILARYDLTRTRLQVLLREMAKAAQPVLQLEPPKPITQDMVDAMAEPLRALGLASGALVQDEEGKIMPAPDGHRRHHLDGLPYYCSNCGLGYGEFVACEEPGCQLETREAAEARKAQQQEQASA